MDETLLRAATLSRVLKTDVDLKENFNLAKQSVEYMNRAACCFVRTLTKSCAVSSARSGHKGRIDVAQLEQVIRSYPQLAFLDESGLPN